MAANRTASKSAAAFRTISEVSDELEVPQHVLRFWETKFTQVRPMKRGGGRRYYRPEDIELLRRIRDLLYSDGYTIKGVQKLLREGQVKPPAHEDAVAEQERAGAPPPVNGSALEVDTASDAGAGAQQTGQGAGSDAVAAPAKATAAHSSHTGRAEGPAARAATATGPTGGAPRTAGSSGQAAQGAAAHPGLSDQQRGTIRSVLEQLRAARAELKRRTGD